MLSKIFRGTGPGVLFMIIVTLILLWISAFIDPGVQMANTYESKPMPLYAIMKMVTGTNVFAGLIFTFLVLIFVLFLLVNFNTSVFFLGERTFLPAILYVLFSALLPLLQVHNPVLPATVFLMLALKRIMESYRKPGTVFNFFDAAVFISTGSLFYANCIWFGVLVFIGIVLLRSGNVIEIINSLIGFVVPYVLLFGIYYVLGKDIEILVEDIRENLFTALPETSFTRIEIVALIFTGLMILVSMVFLLRQLHTRKIKSRKTFYLLLWVFVISVVLYIVLPSVSVEMLWIAAIPLTYILSHYFIFVRKKIIPEIFFTGFFLLILLIQVFSIF